MKSAMRLHGLSEDGGDLPVPRSELEARIKRLREQYASQAKFADAEPSAYFREFIRRLDEVLKP